MLEVSLFAPAPLAPARTQLNRITFLSLVHCKAQMGARHRPNNMINPQVFVGEKFTIDGETVMIAGYPAGLIKQSRSRYDKGRWEWRITATLMPRGITSSGMAKDDEVQITYKSTLPSGARRMLANQTWVVCGTVATGVQG